MCGRFELKTKFEKLPKVLKQDYPSGLDSKYETQSLIRPNDPVLVIKNEYNKQVISIMIDNISKNPTKFFLDKSLLSQTT